MCDYFSSTDPILYESRRRSLRIHGVSTSIRLENLIWEVLSDIAMTLGCTTNALIGRLYDEVAERHGQVTNFTSFLRATCIRHLALMNESRGRSLGALPALDGPGAHGASFSH